MNFCSLAFAIFSYEITTNTNKNSQQMLRVTAFNTFLLSFFSIVLFDKSEAIVFPI